MRESCKRKSEKEKRWKGNRYIMHDNYAKTI